MKINKLIKVAHGETKLSVICRWCKSFCRSLVKKYPHSNHYCLGESGSGEWSCISEDIPSRCYYCKEPNFKLKCGL